jgi:hypothetical protein
VQAASSDNNTTVKRLCVFMDFSVEKDCFERGFAQGRRKCLREAAPGKSNAEPVQEKKAMIPDAQK